MRIKYLLISITVFSLTMASLEGQNPMGLYFMETIPQSNSLNPAMQPRSNIYVALPSVNESFQSDLAFKNIFQDVGPEWVSPLSKRYNFDDLYKVAGKAVNFNQTLEVDPIGFGFRSGRDYFSFSFGVKSLTRFSIPSDLFKIPEKGFPHGEKYDLSPFGVNQFFYREIALGYSRQWDEYFTFGVKLKPLFGMGALMTSIDRFELSTSRKAWELGLDGTVYSSGPLDVQEGEEPGDFPGSIDEKELEGGDVGNYLGAFNNMGLALDMGAVYEHDENWTFSASLTNLGYIKWKEDLNNLSFSGDYSFEGVTVDASNEDGLDAGIEEVGDSIKKIVNFNVDHDSFSSALAPSLYMGASYKVHPAITFGVISRSSFQKQNFRQDFSVSANLQPYSFVALNLNYSKRINGANGLGTALMILGGPLQFYLAADYLPTRYAPVSFNGGEPVTILHRQKELNFKIGLNLIFGRHGYRDEPMLSLN